MNNNQEDRIEYDCKRLLSDLSKEKELIETGMANYRLSVRRLWLFMVGLLLLVFNMVIILLLSYLDESTQTLISAISFCVLIILWPKVKEIITKDEKIEL